MSEHEPLICPYCDYEDNDVDYSDYDSFYSHTISCEDCRREFRVSCNIFIEWFTWEVEGEKDKEYEKEIVDHPNQTFFDFHYKSRW